MAAQFIDVSRRRGIAAAAVALARRVLGVGRLRRRRALAALSAPRSALMVSVQITPAHCSSEAVVATSSSLFAQAHPHWRLLARPNARDAGPGRLEPLGDLVAIVAAGDVLHPEALAWLAHAAACDPRADVVYTDEERERVEGGAPQPYRKPDWSPELLLSEPYALHCVAIRRELYLRLGGLGPEADEAAQYAFVLRATAAARRVGHVRRVLCRRPAESGLDPEAGLRVVAEVAQSLDPPARAAPGARRGTFRLVRRPNERPCVTLVVITSDPVSRVDGRGEVRILANFLTSVVARSTYPDYRLLVVDDGDISQESLAIMRESRARRVTYPDSQSRGTSFNFSRKVNFALSQVDTDYFVLLNDDLEVIAPDWIEALMDYAVIPGVGAVGAHLLFADGRTQHAGVVAAGADGPAHRFYGHPPRAADERGSAEVVCDYSAVTAAVLASRCELALGVGAFDEAFALHYNDVDFCLRLRRRGYRIVFTPFSRLYHFEHTSVRLSHPAPSELKLFRQRWGAWCDDDPLFPRL
jgi:GT2 family glycosyltransferase